MERSAVEKFEARSRGRSYSWVFARGCKWVHDHVVRVTATAADGLAINMDTDAGRRGSCASDVSLEVFSCRTV